MTSHEPDLRRPTVWLVIASLLAAPVAPLAAQQPPPAPPPRADSMSAVDSLEQFIKRTVTVSGFVRDTADRPVIAAEIRVGEGAQAVATLSNQDGSFFLRGAPPDTSVLSVRRIGYQPVDVTLTAKAGLQVDLSIRLTPVTVVLGTMFVEGKAMNLELRRNGFYTRQRLGQGTYFAPEDMERHQGTLTGLLREVPGLSIVHGMGGRTSIVGRRGVGACQLAVILDDFPARWASEMSPDYIVPKEYILAVEVYTTFQRLPPQYYSKVPRGCGAVVIWTKDFEQRRQEREQRKKEREEKKKRKAEQEEKKKRR